MTRPPAAVGWLYMDAAFGRPNAHFNLSPGTSAAVIAAAFAVWNRELVASALQPFHDDPAVGSLSFALPDALHCFRIVFGSPAGMLPIFRPPTNSAVPRLMMSFAARRACAW